MISLTGLVDGVRNECYDFFDKKIRLLPKDSNGRVNAQAFGLADNDVDAFRHACVSGVLTYEFSETVAFALGWANERLTWQAMYDSSDPRVMNMDDWNNAVGRKYGSKAKSREEIFKLIQQALKPGELIIKLDDPRQYSGPATKPINKSKPVIVLKEGEKGRNELFYDQVRDKVLTREDFVTLIEKGEYPHYTVKLINDLKTPVSKPDSWETNNLS